MSAHYTASQYNEPFWPKRLRNWSLGVNPWPGAHAGCPRPCPTNFIADNDGHLFPHIYRNGCTSPWGDYRTSIWEEPMPCCCIEQLRNPYTIKKPTCVSVCAAQYVYPKAASMAGSGEQVCGRRVPSKSNSHVCGNPTISNVHVVCEDPCKSASNVQVCGSTNSSTEVQPPTTLLSTPPKSPTGSCCSPPSTPKSVQSPECS